MSRAVENLIAELAAEARPVKRLPPPNLRAAAWLALILGLASLAILRFADLQGFVQRNSAFQPAIAWTASLLTGVGAVVASAHLALPDRSRRWALVPLPFLAVWLLASGWGCLGLAPASQGHSENCLVFILGSGAVIGGFLVWRLRRARPLAPRLTGGMAALGAAGIGAAVLQFFHPFTITWLDLGAHLAAAAAVVGLGGLGGGGLLAAAGRRRG